MDFSGDGNPKEIVGNEEFIVKQPPVNSGDCAVLRYTKKINEKETFQLDSRPCHNWYNGYYGGAICAASKYLKFLLSLSIFASPVLYGVKF